MFSVDSIFTIIFALKMQVSLFPWIIGLTRAHFHCHPKQVPFFITLPFKCKTKNMQMDSMIHSGPFRILTLVSEHRISAPSQYVTLSFMYLTRNKNISVFKSILSFTIGFLQFSKVFRKYTLFWALNYVIPTTYKSC